MSRRGLQRKKGRGEENERKMNGKRVRPPASMGPVSFVFVALMTPRGMLAASAMRIRERLRSRGDGELAFSAAVQFFSQGGES